MTYTDAISCLEDSYIYRVAACNHWPESFWPSLTDALMQAARVGIAEGCIVTIERTTHHVDYGQIVQPCPPQREWRPVRRVSIVEEKIS